MVRRTLIAVITILLCAIATHIASAFQYDNEETMDTNTWWYADVEGAQYGLSDTSLAQVFIKEGRYVVRTVKSGNLVVHCHLPNGRIQRVLIHITGDAIDGSELAYDYQEECLRYVNEYRMQYGLPMLQLNYQLSEYAKIRAQEIAFVFDHDRPDGSKCFTVLPEGSYKSVGENIAKGQKTPREVVDAWFNSPAHRENMLKPEFTQMGLACFVDLTTDEAMFWAQLFAS